MRGCMAPRRRRRSLRCSTKPRVPSRSLRAGRENGRLRPIRRRRGLPPISPPAWRSPPPLPARDWLADNRRAFPPLAIDRFFIHGSHYRDRVQAGMIGIRVDATTAFGTGEHASTRGCLLALAALARRRRFRRPLDIGTGTGILAIAAAKRLHRRVWASDIDPVAAAVARDNAAKNGVAGLVRVRAAPGYRDRALRRRRYDLVLSNILARPLALLAPELARVLAPDGRAVLSGLLARQEALVLAAHRRCGLALERRYRIEGWSTLVLRRRSRTELARMREPPILQGR